MTIKVRAKALSGSIIYILLTQCYLHRGTCLNAMEVLYLQPLIPPKRFDIFPPITGGCSEGLGAL